LLRVLPFLVVLLNAGSLAAAEEGPRQVLLIHSFGRDFSPFAEVAARFRTRLAELSPEPVEFIDASLEMARFDGEHRDGPLLAFLQAIHRDRPPDLLVPVGAPAAMFVTRHRESLFPASPVLLLSADKRRIDGSERITSVTSVGVDIDLAAILANITDLLPRTENVYFVGGTSPMEKFWESELRREWTGRGNGIAFHWLTDRPVAEIRGFVRDLPPRSAIFVGIVNRDAAGVPHESSSALRAIRANSSAPVFGYSEQQMGEGIVGGRLSPLPQVGDVGAAIAVKILGGEVAGDIPPRHLGLTAPVYDWRELKRWNIPESSLPAGATVLFREPGLWETHRGTVLLATGFIALQTALIGRLLAARRRARETDAVAALQRQELAHLSRVSVLGELAGTLAHELNQPLAAILGNAQVGHRMMQQETPDLNEVSDILGDVADDAKRAGGIIHGMRAMFRKDSATEIQAFDLNEAVAQVLVLLHGEIVSRKAKIELHPGLDLPPVAAGRVEVQQVVLNLVINGMNALEGAAKGALLEIATSLEDRHLHLVVRDHGPGIPEELMPRLFEPFVTTKPGGLGLGLAISRGIAERFRGELKADNHPEGGAVFRLVLPVAAA
jgi:signal transduction histidine kinase